LAQGEAVIETDGASRGNPGRAGAGYILSKDGERLAQGSRFLGISTNNVAEYTGMIMGLEKAVEMGESRVLALTDSLLVARQLEGKYRVRKPHLKPLYRRCMELIGGLESFRVDYVPSSENRAHALAEEAAGRPPRGKMI